MRLNKIIAGLLMTGAIVSAAAYADSGSGNTAVGKVDAVYVRESRGLYIEKKLLRQVANKELWVDVRTAATVTAAITGEMFKVPAELAIERGDLVATRIGDETARGLNLIPIPNKVTQLVARHDTLMAMTFGLPKSPSNAQLFLQAKAQ